MPRNRLKTALLVLGAIALLVAGLGALQLFNNYERSGRGRGNVYFVRRAWDLSSVPKSEDRVYIKFEDITDDELAEFLEGRDLRVLSVYGCKNITERGLAPLAEHQRLEDLDARHTSVGNGLGDVLAQTHELRELGVADTRVTEFSQDFFDAQQGLRQLWLGNCELTEAMLVRCSRLPHLATLLISGCETVPPAWFRHLAQSQSICHLGLDDSRLDLPTLQAIMAMPKLNLLQLDGVQGITGVQVADLNRQFPNVEVHDPPP